MFNRKIVLASGNQHKIREFKEILDDFEIISMKDVGFNEDIEENGETFFDNALIKAKAIRKFLDSKNLDYCVLADDSGLCCNGLGGQPAVYSARFAGVNATDENNRQKLLELLEDASDRSAYFCCNLVLLNDNGEYILGVGKTEGEILKEYSGDTSFGYDCIFLSKDLNKSFGDATHEEKNSVSHRGRAIEDLKKNIEENNWRKL